VFFDPARAEQMPWRRKRSGHTVSKGRFVAAQFEALLHDGHWLALARRANEQATRLASGLATVPGIRLGWACQANVVFGIMPLATAAALRANGALFYDWSARSLPAGAALRPGEGIFRFVCSFATTEADVDGFVAAAHSLAEVG
jgi:threonine aldolase